jgi:hypothetical protein
MTEMRMAYRCHANAFILLTINEANSVRLAEASPNTLRASEKERVLYRTRLQISHLRFA